jgi:hypothetical protein
MLSAPILSFGQNAPEMPWSDALVRQVNLWTIHMNDAVVQGDHQFLRVEIAPGKNWAIAAIQDIQLPSTVTGVRVRVHSITGGGRWLVRFHGDFYGEGNEVDYGPFQGETITGQRTITIDPRMMQLKSQPPIMVQLGLEGNPGASVEFESLEFLQSRVSGISKKAIPGQKSIEAVDYMPNVPQPFHIIDWKQRALQYDRFVFDFHQNGRYLPLIWLDNTHVNIPGPAFGLCSYVGDGRQGGDGEESINCMAAVLGASLVGIDKNRQQYDYVSMCRAFYHSQDGSHLILNNTRGSAGGSFWYDIMPHILFYALADKYPHKQELAQDMRSSANRWHDATVAMGGSPDSIPNFDHTAFNFQTMQPVDNGQWKEPDSAAGIAWIEYAAWNRFHDSRYLQTAEESILFLDQCKGNPYYEVLLPWGVITAARMNAELGRHYNLDRLLNWCFGISSVRGGWGVTVQKWGDYDCAGLVGSVDNRGGYAFMMNTFAQAAALIPLVRYDPQYACAIGKWMLNLTNAARLFYPDGLPSKHQSPPLWPEDKQHVVAYEGLRANWQGESPCATGDPVAMKWGPKTDLGLYGSSYVGFLGAIVKRTTDDKILALDCLATDFYHKAAYPTLLCYNPYSKQKNIQLPFIPGRHDLYDLVTHKFVKRNVSGKANISIPPGEAVLVVFTPSHGKVTKAGGKMLINGVIVDYHV